MFIPFREMGRQSSYGIEFAQLAPGYSILPLSEAVDRIDTGMAALGWANDLVLLSIEKGTEVAGVSEVKPTQVQGLTRVQLPGFQRLLVHKMLAEARLSNKPLFDDEILLQTGMWRRAVATDFSPTCLLIPLMHEEASRLEANIVTNFGHTCQSLDKTSGAPLFEFDGPELRLVAIHNGALSFNGDDNPAIPVEATSPKNLAVLALGALNAR